MFYLSLSRRARNLPPPAPAAAITHGGGRGVGHVRRAAPSPIGGEGGVRVSGSAGPVSGAAAGEGAGPPPTEVSAGRTDGRADAVPSGGTPCCSPEGLFVLRPGWRRLPVPASAAGAAPLSGSGGGESRNPRRGAELFLVSTRF